MKKNEVAKRLKRTSSKKQALTYIYLLMILIIVMLGILIALLPGRNAAAKYLGEQKKSPSPDPSELVTSDRQGKKTAGIAAERIEKARKMGIITGSAKKKGDLYIVIDDVGYNLNILKPFLKVPGALTFAVLPRLQYTREAVKMIQEAGKEVIVHLPMEPVNGQDPGPGAILSGMAPATVRQILLQDLVDFPAVKGVNNHMGSLVTSQLDTMQEILSVLKEKELFFLDSKTTTESVAKRAADSLGVPYIMRNSMFLDNTQDKEHIIEAIQEGLKVAEKRGYAVMIGHVWTDGLAEILMELFPQLIEDGYTLNDLADFLTNDEWYENTWN